VVGVESTEVLGNQAPLDYIAGVRDIFVPLKSGASANLVPKKHFASPAILFDHLIFYGITTIFWVAPALSLCADLNAFSHRIPTEIRKVIFTGSVLPCKDLRIWQDHLPGAMFINQYGPTEITASCTYYRVPDAVDPGGTLPIGVPFKNTEIILLRADDKRAAPGEEGEICVRGSSLANGYYKDVEKTKGAFTINPLNEIFEERIYRTGDVGVYDADGVLWFKGRKDNQIKHMGHRVELGEIEDAAAEVEGVDQSVCLYDPEKHIIYLFYTGEADRGAISKAMRIKLPSFMIPKRFVQVSELPLLANGKYDRNQLKVAMK
jgi:non-ribosomal peptide synthetase component F